MTEMISQCPKCMTSFRVTEDQLTVAGGKVRCGYCMNVFMGQDYLISGGEQGMGVADEDVLRSLLDGDDASSDAASFDPSLTSGSETPRGHDIDRLISHDYSDDFGLDLVNESLTRADEDSELAENNPDIKEELPATSADDFFSETEGSALAIEKASDIASAASPDLIEPDIGLIEENLKFDEDDLRNSTDEDWALELLAELEGTGKYKDSTEASDAYVKELLSDTEGTQFDANGAASNESSSAGNQNHRSGLGFEEIIVDVVPPLDDGQTDNGRETSAETVTGLETSSEVSIGDKEDPSTAEFSDEFSNVNAAPALGQSDSADAEGTDLPERESAAAGELETDSPEQLADSNLFEDAASVYQHSLESVTGTESDSPSTVHAIDDLIFEGADEPKRRKTDFLPQDIDIAQAPAMATTSGNVIEWKWIAGSLGMVLLMLVQYSYFYWGDLTASAKTRPMFVSLCNVVGCELPPYRSLSRVKTDQLSVRSHPDSETALIVDIILTNRAELAQPFPVLQLTFFDIRSQPIATRKFFPNEYLDGELRGLSSMPSDNPIRLALEIMDPGADAINYELNLLPTL
ncbi:MAG: DUF3426 domain-containing protein [Pseudomonadota bacterium]